jgi:hypothetical protein
MKKFWTVVGILVFCAGMGWGDDYRWMGGGNGFWTDHNWEDPAAPGVFLGSYPGENNTSDTVFIPSDTVIVEALGLYPLGSVTINGGDLDLNGQTLTTPSLILTGTSTISDSITGGNLTTTNLDVSGFSGTVTNASTVIMGGGTVTVGSGAVTVSGGTLSLGN